MKLDSGLLNIITLLNYWSLFILWIVYSIAEDVQSFCYIVNNLSGNTNFHCWNCFEKIVLEYALRSIGRLKCFDWEEM